MYKKALAWIATAVFSLATGMPDVAAQEPDQTAPVLTQEELDQLLAPVALYPDALLAQVLMAATYPLEIVQASRFLESRPGLQDDALAKAVAPMPWDPSVKSLTQFPSVLAMMNDELDWTQRLGNAFVTQQGEVMDTVQQLRLKAQLAGNLQSTQQQRIVQQDQFIEIEPIDPQVLYVPYYNPTIVYGNWWWPQRPPVVWMPPPRYRPSGYTALVGSGIVFGAGIGIVRSVYHYARPDWRRHHLVINDAHHPYSNGVTNADQHDRPTVWQHDRRHDQIRHGPGNATAASFVPPVAPRPATRPEQSSSRPNRSGRQHRAAPASKQFGPDRATAEQHGAFQARPSSPASREPHPRPAARLENHPAPRPQMPHRAPPVAAPAPAQPIQHLKPESRAPERRAGRQEHARPTDASPPRGEVAPRHESR